MWGHRESAVPGSPVRGHQQYPSSASTGTVTRRKISTPQPNQRFAARAKSLHSPCIILDLPNQGAESPAKLSLTYQLALGESEPPAKIHKTDKIDILSRRIDFRNPVRNLVVAI